MPRMQTEDVLAHTGGKIVDFRDVAESKSPSARKIACRLAVDLWPAPWQPS